MRVHCDLMTKHKNRPYALQNNREPQIRELKRFKMFFFCSKQRHYKHQMNGMLQVRMVGMRQSNEKKLLKKEDGERNLHFPSCPPGVQAALRETRHAEWKKCLNFSAGVILTDEEVRQLTDAGCKIYPMQWIEVDKNAHLRRDDDYVTVFAKYKGRLVGCGNFKTTEGLRTDSPSGAVDSNNIICSWCAQAHVSTHACDFTNGYFQGQEIDRTFFVQYSS